MSSLFHEILYRPLFNLLVGIYNVIPGNDLGIAIILLTIIVRLIFVPLSIKALVSQRELAMLQPKIQELQAKYKDDKQALAQAQMQLYREHKVNPFSGCVPILIQLPIIWILYKVFINGVTEETLGFLYRFVENPGAVSQISMGFLNLAEKNPAMAILAGLLQGVQSWLTVKMQKTPIGDNPAAKMTQQMMYFFPVMITVIAWSLPAGLVLYWIATTVFAIGEQLFIRRRYAK